MRRMFLGLALAAATLAHAGCGGSGSPAATDAGQSPVEKMKSMYGVPQAKARPAGRTR